MKSRHSPEFEEFDKVMGGLLAVPYSEVQQKLAEQRKAKAKKKKRPTLTASSRVAVSGKRHGT